jgi:hypothetical protein
MLFQLARPLLLVLIALAALSSQVAHADPLLAAFPRSDWKEIRPPNAIGFECITEKCGLRSQTILGRTRYDPKLDENIISGTLNREWAERLAKSRARGSNDQIRIISFVAQKTSPVGFEWIYRCDCNGQTSFVGSKTISTPQGVLTYVSTAPNQKLAVANMNKLVRALTRASSPQ